MRFHPSSLIRHQYRFEKNFFQYVNEFRVEQAKKLLKETNSKLSILGIAYESGFNSKTSFNTTFKKLTGQTLPSSGNKSGFIKFYFLRF
ncbi:AraC family transcriptional regulator [Chryseobacterium arthrosphaerae]|uniref:AraC family transcriptional regulator n=1 Tax=Chryseobacterium arthrosphaerae TaxID=651561 RepID=A0A3S0VH92_9FLAO|nr:AraC family transcriptional regulator [Chryseobacterium arthrosphaerae]